MAAVDENLDLPKPVQRYKISRASQRGRPTGRHLTAGGLPRKIIPGKVLAFKKLGIGQKLTTLFTWLGRDSIHIKKILSCQALLKKEHIEHISLSNLKDSFSDKDVKIAILSKYCEPGVLEKLTGIIAEKQEGNIYHCDVCGKLAEEDTVRCDSCLIWYHFECVQYERQKQWFCSICLPQDKDYVFEVSN